ARAGWPPGRGGTGGPAPEPARRPAAPLPFGAMAGPREKSPRLYRIPAGRTYRPVGSTVASPGMGGATPPLGPAALAVWGGQYATANAHSDSAVAPASQRETLPRRRRAVPKSGMASRSSAMKIKWTIYGHRPTPDPTVPAVNKTDHRRPECLSRRNPPLGMRITNRQVHIRGRSNAIALTLRSR